MVRRAALTPAFARRFGIEHVVALDDLALSEVLTGVDATTLGSAARTLPPASARRLRSHLGPAAAAAFDSARDGPAERGAADAGRAVVEALLWPLVYWHTPGVYDELIAGERVHPAVLETIGIEGRVVCDVGAGTGRFTLAAAASARRVVAVDLMPPLLEILDRRVAELGAGEVELRRGGFTALPLAAGEAEVTVSCSAVTSAPGCGGDAALAELERVTAPGGRIAVIWPDRPEWFTARGYARHQFAGNLSHRFRSAESAVRLCRDFYGERAAEWVRRHGTAEVPYEVLGVRPPNDVFIRERGP